MELDWENSFDDWDDGDYWGNLAQENFSGPKRNLGDFSNQDCTFASKDYAAAVSRPHSCVPAALGESEKQDTLQKHGSVPDSMNIPDCDWWWVDLVDIGWLFYF